MGVKLAACQGPRIIFVIVSAWIFTMKVGIEVRWHGAHRKQVEARLALVTGPLIGRHVGSGRQVHAVPHCSVRQTIGQLRYALSQPLNPVIDFLMIQALQCL